MNKFLAFFLSLTLLATVAMPAMASNDVVDESIQDTDIMYDNSDEISLTAEETVEKGQNDKASGGSPSGGGGSNSKQVEHSIEAYRAVGNKTVIKGSTVANDEMAYYVTPNGATQKTNTQSTILSSKQNLVIAKFPIPKLNPGKIIDRYIIQFISQDTSGSAISVLKLEGTDYDFKTLTSKDERIQNILSNRASYVATDHPVIGEKHETLSSVYRNFADVTTYAKECADKGQEYFYVIVGCTSSTRNMMFNVTWSEYIKKDTYHAYYYSDVWEFPFELVDEEIQGGESAFPADGEIYWEFSNDVMDFTAKANGEDVRVVIDGTKVTLDEPLKEITAYELTIEARDEWGQEITKTYKFATGFKTGATGPENPILGTYDVAASVVPMGGGYSLMELSFYLLTEFEDVNEVLEVRDSEGNDTGVEFIYYDYNQKYEITEPLDLVDGVTYELVLKAGISDIHGNALEEDLVVTKFYAGETPEEVGFDGEDSLSVFAYVADSKIVIEFDNPIYSNRAVDVAVFKDGEIIHDDTYLTSKAGMMDSVEVSVSTGKFEVIVRPQNAPDCYGESFIFCSEDDVKRLWKVVAIDGEEKDIAQEWEYIEHCFGFDNKYMDEISDTSMLINKLYTYRSTDGETITAEMTAENLLKMHNRFFNAYYFTALDNTTEIDKVKEFVTDVEEALAEHFAETYDFWKEALESKYADATVQAFVDTDNKGLLSLNNVAEVMEIALDAYRCGLLLDQIADTANISQVGHILSIENNLRLLGVSDFAERYEALNNKKTLYKAISDKEYADANAFAVAFEKALKDAEANDDKKEDKPSKKPSSSSGGRGSSSTTGTQFMSSVPSSQTPFVTFTDIENVAWAKDHIIKLYNAGVINGKSSTEFAPNDNITREEFTKLIVSMTKLTGDSELTFADVPADSWFASYVKAAVSNSVVNGIGNGLFGAGSNATRQDIAVMIVNALKAKGVQITSETANFADNAAIADYAKEAVAFLNAKGVITGDESANFNPTAKATRAEVAVMLSRLNDIFMKEVK